MKHIMMMIIMLLFVASCEKKSPPESNEEPLADKINRETEQEINEIAMQYNAKTDWEQSIDSVSVGLFPKTYTIDVQHALIPANKQPVAFTGDIDDIIAAGDGAVIRFYNEYSRMLRGFFKADIRFELNLSPEQFGYIENHRREKKDSVLYDSFVAIAQISKVTKVRFNVNATSSFGDEDAEIQLEDSNIFIATGKCIAIKCLLCE